MYLLTGALKTILYFFKKFSSQAKVTNENAESIKGGISCRMKTVKFLVALELFLLKK